MTSAKSLSILRRLDEIERKLDSMLEELRTPKAIGYSGRRGSLPRKDSRKELAQAALKEQISGADKQVPERRPSG